MDAVGIEPAVIKSGDHVKHRPSGEEWLVAVVRDGDLYPAGWPCTRASISDCELIASCGEDDSQKMLRDCAKIGPHRGEYDPRRTIATQQIHEQNLRRIGIEPDKLLGKPRVICLCGSTRFMDAFHAAGWKFTLEGYVVLSVGVCKHASDHGGEALGEDVAERLDYLHFAKIDMADTVFVLNVGGYIGNSTRREIDYASLQNKEILYLEPID